MRRRNGPATLCRKTMTPLWMPQAIGLHDYSYTGKRSRCLLAVRGDGDSGAGGLSPKRPLFLSHRPCQAVNSCSEPTWTRYCKGGKLIPLFSTMNTCYVVWCRRPKTILDPLSKECVLTPSTHRKELMTKGKGNDGGSSWKTL